MEVPHAFRTDNDTEYLNSMFVDFCNDLGIRREFTAKAPLTPQQNGPVESAISREFKAGHAARLGVPQLYSDICLEEIRGCTDAAGTILWLESLLWASECFNSAETPWITPIRAVPTEPPRDIYVPMPQSVPIAAPSPSPVATPPASASAETLPPPLTPMANSPAPIPPRVSRELEYEGYVEIPGRRVARFVNCTIHNGNTPIAMFYQ